MKITKSFLKQVIKEEIEKMEEAGESVEIFTIKFTGGTPNSITKTSTIDGKTQEKFISAADHIETLMNLQKTLNSPVDPYQGGKYKTTGD